MSIAVDLEAGATVVGTLLLIGSTFRGVIKSGRDRAEKAATDKAAYGAEQFEAGARSRDPEFRQMASELKDAYHDRDEAVKDAREWRAAYLRREET